MRNLLFRALIAAGASLALPIAAWAQISSIERVSVNPSGGEPNGNSAGESNALGAVISEDERYVAFVSDASDLTAGDTEGFRDVFVRDLSSVSPSTLRITAGANSHSGLTPAGLPNLPVSTARHVATSGDGRRIVFESLATNLSDLDTLGFSNIFLYDDTVSPAEIRLISRPNLSSVALGHSFNPAISRNGNVVVFSSVAPQLFTGDDENMNLSDVFLLDLQSGMQFIEKVNFGNGVQANDHSYDPAVNDNGLLVAFTSQGTNIAALSCTPPIRELSTTNKRSHVYIRNRGVSPGCTVLVDRSVKGTESNGNSGRPAMSADGRRIAFVSSASNLVAGDTNGKLDVFVAELSASFEVESIRRVSVGSDGGQGNGDSGIGDVSISADGRYVTFKSAASNLLPAKGDKNGPIPDIFIHDLNTGQTGLVTRNLLVAQSTTPPGNAHVNGSSIVFDSAATNLIAGSVDALPNSDVFRAQIGAPLPAILTKDIVLVRQPVVLVSGSSATVIMGEFFAERAKRRKKKKKKKPTTRAAEIAYLSELKAAAKLPASRARAANARQTKPLRVNYVVDVKRGGAPFVSRNSKKNTLTVPNLPSGSYSTSYRVQLKKGKRTRVQSNQSPEASFTVP